MDKDRITVKARRTRPKQIIECCAWDRWPPRFSFMIATAAMARPSSAAAGHQQRQAGRTSSRDIVNHPHGQRDDVANCVAGALYLATVKGSGRASDDPPEQKRQPVILPDTYAGTGYGWLSI
jgi:hypothetical protein